jgi:hypothetical protein
MAMPQFGENHSKGMGYGGMPADSILQKLEITQGLSGAGDVEDMFDDHARRELADWRPVPGFMEADMPRRNDATARGLLNTRYNGTRGTHSELPKHEGMFYGFLDNDPRGVSTDPRMENMAQQMRHRINHMEPLMGKSVGHGDGYMEADRPMTHTELQNLRVRNQEETRRRMKVFLTSKDGRSTGSNVVDVESARMGVQRARAAQTGDGGEHWRVNECDDSRSDPRSFETVGFTNSRDARRPLAGIQIKHQSLTGGDFPTHRYGRLRGNRTKASGKEAMVVARDPGSHDQAMATSRAARSNAGNKALAHMMSAGAQRHRSSVLKNPNAIGGEFGGNTSPAARAHGRLALESDIALVHYQSVSDQERASQMVGRHTVGGLANALAIRADASGARQQVAMKTQRTNLVGALATNMAQAARSVRDAEDTIEAIHSQLAAGVRFDPHSKGDANRAIAFAGGRGALPSANTAAGGGFDSAKQQGVVTWSTSAGAGHLTPASYKGATPIEGSAMYQTNLGIQSVLAAGQPIVMPAVAQNLKARSYRNKAPEYAGLTQVAPQVDYHEQEFGLPTRRDGAFTRSTAVGNKSPRADRLLVTGEALDSDQLGEGALDLASTRFDG